MYIDLACPYCNKCGEYSLDSDIEDGDNVTIECCHCDKTFGFEIRIDVTAEPSVKIPCLNDDEEEGHFFYVTHGTRRCKFCDYREIVK